LGPRPCPLHSRIVLVGIQYDRSTFFELRMRLERKVPRCVLRKPKGEGRTYSNFQGFLVVGFVFLCRSLVCAEILILFRLQHSGSNGKVRSLGSFTGALPTPWPAQVRFNSQFSRSNTYYPCFIFSGMTRPRSHIPFALFEQGRIQSGISMSLACKWRGLFKSAPLARDSPPLSPLMQITFPILPIPYFHSELRL